MGHKSLNSQCWLPLINSKFSFPPHDSHFIFMPEYLSALYCRMYSDDCMPPGFFLFSVTARWDLLSPFMGASAFFCLPLGHWVIRYS